MGITALAGTEFEFYDTTVGKVNGNGYTGFQTKITTGAAADLYSYIVGGNYEVDVRQIGIAANNIRIYEARSYYEFIKSQTANNHIFALIVYWIYHANNMYLYHIEKYIKYNIFNRAMELWK